MDTGNLEVEVIDHTFPKRAVWNIRALIGLNPSSNLQGRTVKQNFQGNSGVLSHNQSKLNSVKYTMSVTLVGNI